MQVAVPQRARLDARVLLGALDRAVAPEKEHEQGAVDRYTVVVDTGVP